MFVYSSRYASCREVKSPLPFHFSYKLFVRVCVCEFMYVVVFVRMFVCLCRVECDVVASLHASVACTRQLTRQLYKCHTCCCGDGWWCCGCCGCCCCVAYCWCCCAAVYRSLLRLHWLRAVAAADLRRCQTNFNAEITNIYFKKLIRHHCCIPISTWSSLSIEIPWISSR